MEVTCAFVWLCVYVMRVLLNNATWWDKFVPGLWGFPAGWRSMTNSQEKKRGNKDSVNLPGASMQLLSTSRLSRAPPCNMNEAFLQCGGSSVFKLLQRCHKIWFYCFVMMLHESMYFVCIYDLKHRQSLCQTAFPSSWLKTVKYVGRCLIFMISSGFFTENIMYNIMIKIMDFCPLYTAKTHHWYP